MFKSLLVIAMITGLFILAISAKAEARTHYKHYTFQRAAGDHTFHQNRRVERAAFRKGTASRRLTRTHEARYHKHRRHHRAAVDANGNLAPVVTANGLVSKVAKPFQEKFQQFIKLVEADTVYPERPDLNERGNRIHDIGCYARGGHMPRSKHYRGLACDIDQTKRNVTSSFMYHITPLAKLVGLTDGATWPRKVGERYTGPDAGHIEVGNTLIAENRPTRTYAARKHHGRKIRMARR